jgi:hypothetical protein
VSVLRFDVLALFHFVLFVKLLEVMRAKAATLVVIQDQLPFLEMEATSFNLNHMLDECRKYGGTYYSSRRCMPRTDLCGSP